MLMLFANNIYNNNLVWVNYVSKSLITLCHWKFYNSKTVSKSYNIRQIYTYISTYDLTNILLSTVDRFVS